MGKVFCIDLGATLSLKSLIQASLTGLTSAECTLSTAGLEIKAKYDTIIGDFKMFVCSGHEHAHTECEEKNMHMHFHLALDTYLSLFVVQNSWVYYRI